MKKQKKNPGALTATRASAHYVVMSLMLLTASTTIYGPNPSNTTTEYAYAQPLTPGAASAPLRPLGSAGLVQFDYLNRQIESLESKLEKTKQLGEAKLENQIEEYLTVDALIEKLYSTVGNTPYVLSGSTTKGWDCSGLTLWFYERYKGITLHHSASTQAAQGKVVDAPIPGDIVAFYYKNRSAAFHVGIYVGGGRFIHAKNRAEDTTLETVDGFAKNNIKVAYIRY